MISTFDECFEKLLGHEGGFTLNPKDRGNWTGGDIGKGLLKGTNWGIAAASYPDLDIKNLTQEQAKAIYKRDFWGCLELDTAAPEARFQIFDAAVNHGIKRAVKLSQEALGLTVDGVIGTQTRAALKQVSGSVFVLKFNSSRLRFYTSLKDFDEFGKGWVNRVAGNLLIAT